MMQPPPPAAMPPAGPVAPTQNAAAESFPTPEDLAQIERDTGYPQTKIMQDIQSTGAQSAAELYPAVYDNTGIDPQAAQVGGGYAPDDSQAMPQAPPQSMAAVDPNPRRAMAQRAMRGDPEEVSESPGMQGAEGPAGEMVEDRAALGAMARSRNVLPHKRMARMPMGRRP